MINEFSLPEERKTIIITPYEHPLFFPALLNIIKCSKKSRKKLCKLFFFVVYVVLALKIRLTKTDFIAIVLYKFRISSAKFQKAMLKNEQTPDQLGRGFY